MSHALPKIYSCLSLRSAAPLLSWRKSWEFHSSIARDALSCCHVMGAYSWSMSIGQLTSLKTERGCSANRPGQNPESYPLAFFTHSELKWFRDCSKNIAGNIPGFNSRSWSNAQERG